MADNTSNPAQPQGANSGQQKEVTRQVMSDLKEKKRIEGDFNDLIKDSINLLKKVDGVYETIEGRIKALSRETINIKQINNELYKAKQKDVIVSQRIADIEKNLNKNQKDRINEYLTSISKTSELEQKRAKLIQDQEEATTQKEKKSLNKKIKDADKLIGKEILRNEEIKKTLGVEQMQLIGMKQAQKITKESISFAENKLAMEKKVNSDIGVTGKLLGFIGEKLGTNNEVYGEMVSTSRDLIETTGKGLTVFQKFNFVIASMGGGFKVTGVLIIFALKKASDLASKLAKGTANALGDFMTMSGDQVIGKLTSGISNIVGKIPMFGGLIAGIVEGFGKLLELSLAEDDKITKIGRELGISKEAARAINNQFVAMSVHSNNVLASANALRESQKELSNELGVTNILSGQILDTNIELSKLAGLDVKSRTAIAESSIITEKSSKEITKSVLGQVGALKLATGISFSYQKIIAEASNLGGVLGLQFAKYPEKLTKSLVTTKALGLELKQLDSMANSFLNFESSISNEFEAQLLTGKNINLNKARELFLNNDLAGAATEITNQVGSAAGFLDLNRIQAESLAQAFGMSRDEMANMLKQQELLAKIGATDMKDAQKKLDLMKAQGKTREEIVHLMGEEAYQSITTASAQEKIAGFLDKIQSAVAAFLTNSPIIPLVNKAMDFLGKPENITKIVEKIQGVFGQIFDVVGAVAASIIELANFFGAGISEDIIELAKSGGDSIRSINFTGGTTLQNGMANKENAASSTNTNTKSNPIGSTVERPVYNFIRVDATTGKAVENIVENNSYIDHNKYSIAVPDRK